MRLELGCPVSCADAPAGELADVVIDPLSRRVTHLVVRPHGEADRARLVPIELADGDGEGIRLACPAGEFEALERVHESAYLRVGQVPGADPDWEIGVENYLALPLYQEMDGLGTVVDTDPHAVVSYDRIPKGEVELRRSSAVTSSDGHHLGHVEGFLVGDRPMADIVLERGHL